MRRACRRSGQWPWRRDVLARLITRLREMGASAVALDIIFPEADRNGGHEADAALADVLLGGRVVIRYALTFDSSPGGPCEDRPLPLAIIKRGDDAEDPFFKATGAICSLPALIEHRERVRLPQRGSRSRRAAPPSATAAGC